MTVILIQSPKHFVGVNGDSKPTTDVPAGSTFTERDEGHEYVWDGERWGRVETVLASEVTAQFMNLGLLAELLHEQRVTNAHLNEITGETFSDLEVAR